MNSVCLRLAIWSEIGALGLAGRDRGLLRLARQLNLLKLPLQIIYLLIEAEKETALPLG